MTPRNPTDDELLHWFELESHVETAGAEPEKGVDAIPLLGPVLDGIAALDRELDARRIIGPDER